MKKKIVSLILTAAFILTGCSKTETKQSQGSDNGSNETTVSSDVPVSTGQTTIPSDLPTGSDGTGSFNYGEALSKSLLFYELQRSGDLPDNTRCNWRGDSGLSDGSDAGIDLTGGWYDAGDHVKFNLPMAYSAAMIGWSVYEDKASYEDSGQLYYALFDIRWACDYLMKCHPEDEVFYYQVGDGGTDHSWWGPCEVMTMNRPSYKVTKDAPGSAVTGEAAAALAIASIIFEDSDSAYSKQCLEHAESLFKFSNDTRSDAGYTAANGFYDSWSGFYDELSWAGVWLYIATDDDSYLKTSEECFLLAGHDYNWALCWDDVHIGACTVLAKVTGKEEYKAELQHHLDFWSCGTSDGQKITYTPKGLAWLDSWGSLRYASTTAFVASVYSRWDGCPSDKKDIYWDFAVSQADYCLGSTGFSYLIGFGDSYPVHPHHRTSQGSYCNNMGEPSDARHILVGALVGGPDANDNYVDTVSDYCANEVACDYNAGFTGLMAAMYSRYHGKTEQGLNADETPGIEYACDCSANVQGDDFIEIKAIISNMTAWPARPSTNLEFRYYVDLSEVYASGGDASGVTVTTNYMQAGRSDGLKVFDEDAHIYYLSVVFDDGELYPGGQEHYKAEIQVRMKSPNGSWDDSNDYSYTNGAALYENGVLVCGSTPDGSSVSSAPVSNPTTAPSVTTAPTKAPVSSGGTASSGDLSLQITYNDPSSKANAIAGTIDIKNDSSSDIDLSTLTITYYLTSEGGEMTFDCYHAATNDQGGTYTALTDTVSGKASSTQFEISFGSGTLRSGATLTVSFSCHRSDWQEMDLSNDRSFESAENIVVRSDGKTVLGKEE